MNSETLIEKIENWCEREIFWKRHIEKKYTFFADIDGEQILFRLNDFPDEPICSILIEGREFDMEEIPAKWHLPSKNN